MTDHEPLGSAFPQTLLWRPRHYNRDLSISKARDRATRTEKGISE